MIRALALAFVGGLAARFGLLLTSNALAYRLAPPVMFELFAMVAFSSFVGRYGFSGGAPCCP